MKLVALLALLMLAACSDPRFGAAIETDGSGLSVTPTASGNFGGLTVSVRG
jgi:hypothetical protein